MMRQRQTHSQSLPKRAVDSTNEEYKEKIKKARSFIIPVKVHGFSWRFRSCFVARHKSTNNDAANKNQMKGHVMSNPPEKFTKVPKGHEKTCWTDGGRVSFPMVRALRDHGWTKVNDVDDAQIVYQYSAKAYPFTDLKPWQRYGHVPRYQRWNRKD